MLPKPENTGAAVSQHAHSPSFGNGAGVGCRGATPAAASACAEVRRGGGPIPPTSAGMRTGGRRPATQD